MPSARGMKRAGVEYADQVPERMCYVCSEAVEGRCQVDTSKNRGTLGYRHTDCEPAEDATATKKAWVAVAAMESPIEEPE